MTDFLALADRNRRTALDLIRRTQLVDAWRSAGATPRMVGSLAMGLLMKHRDIDFHIYSRPLTPDDEHIMGVEYYQAVLRDGVRTWDEFAAWRAAHPATGIVEWMP